MVKLYTRQSLHTTTQLLKGYIGTSAKICSYKHKTKHTYYYTATPRLQRSKSQNLVELNTRQSLHSTTQLFPDFSGARAKIWSNYTQHKAFILQHSYCQTSMELEPKFVKLYTRQSLHTATQLLQGSSGTRAKIKSNYTQDKAYILQHSYSKAPVEQEPKLGQIIHKTKPTY